jgi:hypothetical protein
MVIGSLRDIVLPLILFFRLGQLWGSPEVIRGSCIVDCKNGLSSKLTYVDDGEIYSVRLKIFSGSNLILKDTFKISSSDFGEIFSNSSEEIPTAERYFSNFFNFDSQVNGIRIDRVKPANLQDKAKVWKDGKFRLVSRDSALRDVATGPRLILFYTRSWREDILELVWVPEKMELIQLKSEY